MRNLSLSKETEWITDTDHVQDRQHRALTVAMNKTDSPAVMLVGLVALIVRVGVARALPYPSCLHMIQLIVR
jgi:hypothetical protein